MKGSMSKIWVALQILLAPCVVSGLFLLSSLALLALINYAFGPIRYELSIWVILSFILGIGYLCIFLFTGPYWLLVLIRKAINRNAEKITPDPNFNPKDINEPVFTSLNKIFRRYEEVLDYQQRALEEISDETDMMVERYEVLTENLAAAIVIRDAKGKVAYCSPYTETLTGFSVEDIYNTNDRDFFLDIVHPDDKNDFNKAIRISSCGEAFQSRYRFYHKSGIEMWADMRIVPIFDEAGDVTSTLSIIFDVTSLIRRQQQIEEKNRDLEDFSYMISHDLKSPIFTIKGMLQVLQEDLKVTEESPEYEVFQHMNNAITREEQLVQSVVDYSKIGRGNKVDEDIDLEALLNDIKNELKPRLAEAGCELNINVEVKELRSDRLKLYQILSNLIGNAIKYRSPERKLEISVSTEQISSRMLQISVKDNGLGIPENRLTAIFRPFQRAHGRDIEGSGIGLACVKKLTTLLDGYVTVESEEGEGSCFKVALPFSQGGE